MSRTTPALLIGLDATEVSLVDELVDQGRLPTLSDLRDRGHWGVLRTRPTAFLSMVWPTFSSARDVSRHGWYFNKLWRPDRQRLEYASPAWLPQEPFWQHLDPECRVALLDIPCAYRPGRDLNGVFLNGWQNHDDFGKYARPRGLWRDLTRRLGRPALKPEWFGRQSIGTLLRQREEALEATRQFGQLCERVLEMGSWDLFVAVFGSAHRGTHYLWDLSQVDTRNADAARLKLLRGARNEIYEACDRALGRILEKAPANARILVFSLHGMGENSGWSEHFRRLMHQIQHGDSEVVPRSGLAYRLKRAVPWTLARQLTTRLPAAVNHALVPMWSRRMYDWKGTRYFPLPVDLNGYVRINLRGREAKGIVEPGPEYEALLAELREAVLSFEILGKGERVVTGAELTDDLVGHGADRRWVLPDLVLRWSKTRAADSEGLVSPRCGEIRWQAGRPLPSGRSGNHLERGWYVAAGDGIGPGRLDREVDAVEMVPTAFHWTGNRLPVGFQGRPVPELTIQPEARTRS